MRPTVRAAGEELGAGDGEDLGELAGRSPGEQQRSGEHDQQRPGDEQWTREQFTGEWTREQWTREHQRAVQYDRRGRPRPRIPACIDRSVEPRLAGRINSGIKEAGRSKGKSGGVPGGRGGKGKSGGAGVPGGTRRCWCLNR